MPNHDVEREGILVEEVNNCNNSPILDCLWLTGDENCLGLGATWVKIVSPSALGARASPGPRAPLLKPDGWRPVPRRKPGAVPGLEPGAFQPLKLAFLAPWDA